MRASRRHQLGCTGDARASEPWDMAHGSGVRYRWALSRHESIILFLDLGACEDSKRASSCHEAQKDECETSGGHGAVNRARS